jgi:hypothetical protein
LQNCVYNESSGPLFINIYFALFTSKVLGN